MSTKAYYPISEIGAEKSSPKKVVDVVYGDFLVNLLRISIYIYCMSMRKY